MAACKRRVNWPMRLSEIDFFGLDSVAEHGFVLKDLPDAIAIRIITPFNDR